MQTGYGLTKKTFLATPTEVTKVTSAFSISVTIIVATALRIFK